ncbi:uncharacterized, partial [Tachysurus ichikawai]
NVALGFVIRSIVYSREHESECVMKYSSSFPAVIPGPHAMRPTPFSALAEASRISRISRT